MENTECPIVKACIPLIDFKSGCVSWPWCITTLCFQLLQTHWVAFQVKNNIKRPLLALHLCTEVMRCIPQTIHYAIEWSSKENEKVLVEP